MKRVTVNGGKIPRSEWDFSKVPYEQLEACFAWEYGREWELLRHGSPQEMIPPKTNGGTKNPEYEKYQADPERWVGCIRAEALLEYRKQLDTPWQELPMESRMDIMFSDTSGSLVLVECKYTQMDQGELARKELGSRFRTVAFELNWDQSDKRLIADFAAWVRKNRERPAKEQRGRNRRDDLNMLGAMRLLHHLRLEEAVIETTRAMGEPLYGKRPSWERARKAALQVFQEDFLIEPSRWQEQQVPISYAKLEKD